MLAEEDSLKLREALLVLERGDAVLEAMRNRLEEFNIFEAVGMGRLEIRHSNFLAYLLDPKESHGLEDSFVKGLLRIVSEEYGGRPSVSLQGAEDWSLRDLDVQRERDNIDILLTEEEHRLVVLIENKTSSNEHDEQLLRYAGIVENRHPGYQQLFLYLSPDEPDEGELSDKRYVSITYTDIEKVICRIVDAPPQSANDELLSILEHHYLPLLRRRDLVPDQELAQLAASVYRKHKAAIDYIIEHQSQMGSIEALVSEHEPELRSIRTSRNRVAFIVSDWKNLGLESSHETRYGWRLHFQFRDEDKGLSLVLYLRPAQDELGRKIVAAAREAGHPFRLDPKQRAQNRVLLYTRSILRAGQFDDEPSVSTERIRREWEGFLEKDLPRIRSVIAAALSAREEDPPVTKSD